MFEDEVSILSFDWEKATDNPPHESGEAVMRPLLTKMGLTEEVVNVLISVWVGDKNMYYNGKYKGQMVNGVPMGDPLTKTNLSLAHPICDRYAKIKLARKVISMGVGNGDDGNRIAAGPDRHKYFEYFLEGAALLG
jgi:hypothetical protein